jgi:hypothetical protein
LSLPWPQRAAERPESKDAKLDPVEVVDRENTRPDIASSF